MNPTDIRKKMMGLWKGVFHESDAYISLIFDTYFDSSLVEYEMQGEEMVASLFGVPYSFGNSERSIKGLYLCGLATHPQYRSRGIMTRLLARINDKARAAGYAFTFLLPATDGLRKFYEDRDYVNAFYRVTDHYTSLHDFDREYAALLMEQKEKVSELKKRAYDALTTGYVTAGHCDADIVARIAGLILRIEEHQSDLRIIHTPKDVDAVISGNAVYHGTIYYVCNSRGEVTAAAIATLNDKSVLDVHKVYAIDEGSKFKVLSCAKNANPDASMRVYVSSLEMDRNALWNRTFGFYAPGETAPSAISVTECVYSLAAHAKVYGMVRILDLHEILKFQAESRREIKYSILVKGRDQYTVEQISAKNGQLEVKKILVDSLDKSQSLSIMSPLAVGSILFRRRDTDNMITEAFGIPSINASASLLLD